MAAISSTTCLPSFITEWSTTDTMTVKTLKCTAQISGKIVEIEKSTQTIAITRNMQISDFITTLLDGIGSRDPHDWRIFVENEGYFEDDKGYDAPRHHIKIVLSKDSKVYLLARNGFFPQITSELPEMTRELQVQRKLLDPLYDDYPHEALHEYGYLQWKEIIPSLKNIIKAFPTWGIDTCRTFTRELCKSRISLQFPLSDLTKIREEAPEPQIGPHDPIYSFSGMPVEIHSIICSYLKFYRSFSIQEMFYPISTRQAIFRSMQRDHNPWELLKAAIENRRSESIEARIICYFHKQYPVIKPFIEKIQIARDSKNWEELTFLMHQFKAIVLGMKDPTFNPMTILNQEKVESKLEETRDWAKDCTTLCPSILDEGKTLFEILYEMIGILIPLMSFRVKHVKFDANTRTSQEFEKEFRTLPGITYRKIYQLVEQWLIEIGDVNLEFDLATLSRFGNVCVFHQQDNGTVLKVEPSILKVEPSIKSAFAEKLFDLFMERFPINSM